LALRPFYLRFFFELCLLQDVALFFSLLLGDLLFFNRFIEFG
jgi:hypothetical protein